jgi:hypothetical protein
MLIPFKEDADRQVVKRLTYDFEILSKIRQPLQNALDPAFLFASAYGRRHFCNHQVGFQVPSPAPTESSIYSKSALVVFLFRDQ